MISMENDMHSWNYLQQNSRCRRNPIHICCTPTDLCPIEALTNMANVTPAGTSEPLFSWRDKTGIARPMVKDRVLACINVIFQAWGWGTAFGHSFQIGGTSFYLAQGKIQSTFT